MGEARRKQEADWSGLPRPRDHRCPACGGNQITELPPEGLRTFDITVPWQTCLDCRAVWEAFPASYVRDPVCAEPCDNCAFRPGSPEQRDPVAWRALLETLKPDQSYGMFTGRFYCHKGVPVDLSKGPGNFLFPKTPVVMDGKPLRDADGAVVMTGDPAKMRTCTGFLRMIWARNRKGQAAGDAP